MLKTQPTLHIRQLEGLLGFSRQAYYQYWQRQQGQVGHESQVIDLVKALRQDHPKMGGRKLYDRIKEEVTKREIQIGRDALFELLAANGLLIRQRRRTMRTTFSFHRFRKYPNLIKELEVDRPNQLWPGRRRGGRHYLLVYLLRLSLHLVGDGCLSLRRPGPSA